MMKSKKLSREFKIGAFSIAMIALLYISINYIKSNRIFTSDLTFYAVFDSADGLEASAPVMAKGFRIGTVENVKFNLEKQNILVTLSIQKEYPIALGSKVKIASSGLMGGQIIELNFAQNAQKYANQDTLKSVFEPNLMQLVGTEYAGVKEKLKQYSIKIDQMLDGINGVLSEQNVAAFSGTMRNLEAVSANLNRVLNSKKGNIGSIIANLDSLSLALKSAMPGVNKTLDNFSIASEKLPSALANADSAIISLSAILAKIDNGEGTMGKLISNEELYDNLAAATQNMNVLLTDLKENPKRYVNITVFGKKTYEEKQADKAAKAADKAKQKSASTTKVK